MRSIDLFKTNRASVQPLCSVSAALVLASALLITGCASTGPRADVVYFPTPPAEPRVVHLKSFNSLRDLVPVRRSLADILRGRQFSPYVDTPAGVAYANGHLYVCDTRAGAVHDWDLASGEARRIGVSGNAILGKPIAVAVDDRGMIYVADTDRAEVVAYDADGSFIRRIKPTEHEPDVASDSAYRPVALAVTGPRLYAADLATHQVDIFSTEDGEHLVSFGGPGTDPGRFYFPTGVAADSTGQVFVSDMMNARVQAFDDVHKPTLSMGRPGDRYGDMGKPKHLAVGPDGTVFVADAQFARVHLFNTQGQLLMLLGDDKDGAGGTPMPAGVAVATTLPDRLAAMVPDGFNARYFLFVTNKIGSKRISLYAVGQAR